MRWVTNVMVSVDYGDCDVVEELSRWLDTEAPIRGRDGRVGRVGSLGDTTGEGTRWGDVWEVYLAEVAERRRAKGLPATGGLTRRAHHPAGAPRAQALPPQA